MDQDLSQLSDAILIHNVKNSLCSGSYLELSKRHSDLFYKITHKYLSALTSMGVIESELFEEKDRVLYESILSYNPAHASKSKFSTWFANCARYFCLHKLKKNSQMPTRFGEDTIHSEFDRRSIKDYESYSPSINLSGILSRLAKVPDRRISSIFKLRYNPAFIKKRTWQSIADQLDLSIQTTQALHKKGIQLLRKEIAKEKIEVFV